MRRLAQRITISADHTQADDGGCATQRRRTRAGVCRAPGRRVREAYRRYADVLYGVARHIAPDAAEDCVHDALLRVWHAGMYRPERGSLRAFLIVCVRNEALTRLRSAARRFAGEQRDAQLRIVSEANAGSDHVQLARLRAALTALTPALREVIELAYFRARSQTQIAAQLGVPLGTVKSRASLALRTLARDIGPDNA